MEPGGERGDRGEGRLLERGGGVRGVAAAGTEGAGVEVRLVGELLPLSWAAILVPATHSVPRFLARSRITLALIWKAPEEDSHLKSGERKFLALKVGHFEA